MILVELNSNGKLFKLLKVLKVCVGRECCGEYLYLIGKKLERRWEQISLWVAS
jgi:hypothetical protein